MAVCLLIACIHNLQNPGDRPWLIILASVGALMGVISTILAANANILTFVFGLVDVLIYSYTLLDQNMPMTLALHVFYFIPMEFIGFWQWRKRGGSASGESTLKARRLKGKQWLWTALGFIGVFALVMGLRWLFDTYVSHVPVPDFKDMALDCTMTAANITALVLMALAFTDQWYLWVLVNISSIIAWGTRLSEGGPESSYTIAQFLKYIFYLLNSINAIRIWLKLSKSDSAPVHEQAQGLE